MSTLTLLLLTYAPAIDHPRAGYARTTLRSALKLMRSQALLKVHIASDGSDLSHIASLREIAAEYGYDATVTDSERRGYGASFNLATQAIHFDSDFILSLEDDWQLTRELDLDPLINVLSGTGIGCIRMGYLGWTQDLLGRLRDVDGFKVLQFNPDSPEPHIWAGHPRLETRQYQRTVGPWPEGLDPGSTEFVVAQRKEAREGVVWPLDLIRTYGDCWAHIGTIQAREDQKAAV